MTSVIAILLTVLSVTMVGCFGDDDGYSKRTKLQYVPDMADGPLAKTQRSYLDPPDGSVAMNAILYPATAEESAQQLQNPFPNTPDVLAKGERIWNTFCVTCHGPTGKGDNSLAESYPRPPDITNPVYIERTDGYFFHVITFGNVIMPGYGHAIDADERWAAVHYLRYLQNEAN